MVEKTFEFDLSKNGHGHTPRDCGAEVAEWLIQCFKRGKWSCRVTVHAEQIPDRVPWPEWAEGVNKMMICEACGTGRRTAFLLCGEFGIGGVGQDEFGVWPTDERRIAENDGGFVKLSEAENGK